MASFAAERLRAASPANSDPHSLAWVLLFLVELGLRIVMQLKGSINWSSGGDNGLCDHPLFTPQTTSISEASDCTDDVERESNQPMNSPPYEYQGAICRTPVRQHSQIDDTVRIDGGRLLDVKFKPNLVAGTVSA